MPRKFRKVVQKGYYKKEVVERIPTGDSDDEHVSNASRFTETATQTDHIQLEVQKIDASIQTDDSEVVQIMKSVTTQTESEMMSNDMTQTQSEMMMSNNMTQTASEPMMSNDMEIEPIIIDYVICEGNNDERFQPLIIKHKGIFKDSTGILLLNFIPLQYHISGHNK